MRDGRCRSCGAAIVWGKTANGKAMPLDAKPERLFVLKSADDPDCQDVVQVPTYRSHFATCPDADKFRRKEGGGAG